ncbi:MAG: S1C family serine protease [Candidatus Melainabacteria bacterium]
MNQRWLSAGLVVAMTMTLSGLPALSGHSPAQALEAGGKLSGFYPELIADVSEQVAPSVVNIDTERTESVTMPEFPGFLFRPGNGEGEGPEGFSPFGALPFAMPGFPQNGGNGATRQYHKVAGNGSGVIINANGTILTNNHVVAGADDITVTLQGGQKYPAKVLGRDSYTDLALVKIELPAGQSVETLKLKPARLGSSKTLRPGEWVLAIGSPLGYDHTVTVGIVSGVSRRIPDPKTNLEYIQTDAAINPGNSGGPLVNLRGEVIGINTAISGRGQNIGFAIPVDVARDIADSLAAQGKIVRPWIGISMTDLNAKLAESLGLKADTQGVVVAQVMPGSPADKAGFKQGDVIQRLGGHPVASARVIQDQVREKPVNSSLNFLVLRNGALAPVDVKTEQLPDDPQKAMAGASSAPQIRQYRWSFP